MKYKYSRISYFLQIFFGVLALIPFFVFIKKTFLEHNPKDFLVLIFSVSIGLIILVINGSKTWLNKYVELKKNHIHFHAYRNGASIDNFNVKYEDICSLSADIIPLIGVKNIIISLKNGDKFEISRSFGGHKELCYNLINILLKDGYDVEISDVLQKYQSK